MIDTSEIVVAEVMQDGPIEPAYGSANWLNAEQKAIGETHYRNVLRARDLGEALLVKKTELGHGNWLPWLEDNLVFSAATAENYMLLAKKWDRLSKSEQIQNLPVTSVIRQARNLDKKRHAPVNTEIIDVEVEAETVGVPRLPYVLVGNRNELPSVAGIYFVTRGADEVVYVGQTIDLRRRWINHHILDYLNHQDDVRISWIDLRELEKGYIQGFAPILNQVHSSSNALEILAAIADREAETWQRIAYLDVDYSDCSCDITHLLALREQLAAANARISELEEENQQLKQQLSAANQRISELESGGEETPVENIARTKTKLGHRQLADLLGVNYAYLRQYNTANGYKGVFIPEYSIKGIG
jgi:hypothetical protein